METEIFTTIGEVAEVFDRPHATPRKQKAGQFFWGLAL
jgi:hypothetical protein